MSSKWGLLLFGGLVATSYIMAQFILYAFLKDTSSDIFRRKIRFFTLLELILRLSQYAIGGILLVLILQTLFTSEYYAVLPILVLVVSFGSAAITSSMLSFKLFSWFRQNNSKKRNRDLVILLFGYSTAALSIGLAATLTINSAVLIAENPVKITTPEIKNASDGVKGQASTQTNLQGENDSPTVV
jgi:hypothetical protein